MDPIGQVTLETLKKIDPIFNEAIIAGGMVRDFLMGGAFKDIDVFIPIGIDADVDKWFDSLINKLIASEDFTYHDTTWTDQYPTGMYFIMNVKYLGTIPVQLIFTSEEAGENFIQDLFKRFDYNINKVAFDGQSIIQDDSARIDIANHQATLSFIKSPNDMFKSINRFSSWKQRYPNLQFKTTMKFVSDDYLKEREEYYRKYYEQYYTRKLDAEIKRRLYQGNPVEDLQNSGNGSKWDSKYVTIRPSGGTYIKGDFKFPG